MMLFTNAPAWNVTPLTAALVGIWILAPEETTRPFTVAPLLIEREPPERIVMSEAI